MKARIVMLVVLLGLGVALGVGIYVNRVETPVPTTFTSAFQIFGETVRVADRFAGRLMPVSDFDEAELGRALKSFYGGGATPADAYVNDILKSVSERKQKNFEYEAQAVDWNVPNAMALPGGVIFVTTGLLETLDNESQLAAVSAHEVGHVELSHCVDRVKYEITAKKLGVLPLGEIADMTVNLMFSHSFSKTQEHEADLYAWTWLSHSRYDPRGVGASFDALRRFEEKYGGSGYKSGLLRDYFSSHPPLAIRAHEFGNRAARWWQGNYMESRYIGSRNLDELSALGEGAGYADEWCDYSCATE